MRAAGATVREIANHFGIRSENSIRLWLDPEQRERKLQRQRELKLSRPAGTCIDCGGRTSRRKGGEAGFSTRCRECHVRSLSGRLLWTREVIIEAIQRWAREHGGRPPTTLDWKKPDPANGYPSSRAVAGRGRRKRAFVSWCDAIEAAGFERPAVGNYARTSATEGRRIRSYTSSRSLVDEQAMDEALRSGLALESPKRRYSGGHDRDVDIPETVMKRVPPTERLVGDVPAHRLLETFDCQAYGCVRDAEPGELYCRRHLDAPDGAE